MRCKKVRYNLCISFTWLFYFITTAANPIASQAQDYEDVFFSFRYPGIGNYFIGGLYYQDEFYLPISELFNVLEINYNTDAGRFTVQGIYLDADNRYTIDFPNSRIRLGGETYQLQADDYILTDFDYYLTSEVFREVFNLDFSIDLGNLMIHLSTPEIMPAVRRLERERLRQRTQMATLQHEDYELLFDRQRKWFDLGFLDYSLTSNISNSVNNYSYYFAGGAEIMGGDIQGNISGNYNGNTHNYIIRDVRWRYVFDENPVISRFNIGQLSSLGLHQRPYMGFQLSNEPMRPLRYFDEYVMEGIVEPESEVEIFVNNQLFDFQYADDFGQYRFNVPLLYGTSQVRLMTYRPDGSISEDSRRLQVPFTFVPKNTFNYNISVGQAMNPVRGYEELPFIGLANFGYGVTSWLTIGGGAEYFDEIHDDDVVYYGRTSLRLLQNHLINVDYAPDYFLSFSADALYSNSVNWRANYRRYEGLSIYNQSGTEEEYDLSFYIPFNIRSSRMSYRLSVNHQVYPISETSRVSTDINWRIQSVNLRFGYRESIRNIFEESYEPSGTGSAAIIYTTPRGNQVPAMVRGLLMRGQISYTNSRNQFERAELTLSRSVTRRGRFRFNVSHSFLTEITSFELGLVLDFNRVQSTSTVRTNTTDHSYRQNIRGSIGFDSNDFSFHASNRHQVGRSAASIRMFLDNTGSGTFEEGDYLITDNAIRLARVGGRTQNRAGVTRVNNLTAYDIHNVEINQAMISNPLLIPAFTEFSFFGDPNVYKPIEIPFYMGGEVEGEVNRIIAGRESPVSGLRVMLENQNTGEITIARTFSNGQFYATQLRPGDYIVQPDTEQLNNLRLVSRPETLAIIINPTAMGDIVMDVNFMLLPREPEPVPGAIAEEMLTDEERAALEQLGGDMQRLLEILASEEGLDGALCAYRVTISAQVSLARTHISIMDVEDLFGRRFHTRFVGGMNAFAIISDYFVENADATEFAALARQAGFTDAFVTEECRPFPANVRYHIVLEESEIEQEALGASRRMQQALSIGVTVQYDSDRGTYLVRTESTDHFNEIMAAKMQALQLQGIDQVFVSLEPDLTPADYRYILQLGAFPNSELAEDFAIQVIEELNMEAIVFRNFRTNLYEVRLLPEANFIRALRIREMIRNMDGYEAPVILTITDWID